MQAVEWIHVGRLQHDGIDAGEIGLIGAARVVIDLTGIVGDIEISASSDKDSDDVGERQRLNDSIGGSIYHMQPLALLHGKHILAKTHHVTTLVVVKAIVIALSAGQGAADSPLDSHSGHVDDKDTCTGRHIALVGTDGTISPAVVHTVGRLTEAQDAALLLERDGIEHGKPGANRCARRLGGVGLLAYNKQVIAKQLSMLRGHTQLGIGIDHGIDVVLHLVVVIIIEID